MGKKILYVEDNPNNMLLIRRILNADGHLLVEAVDGQSGWNAAVRERPDLILMDLRLPGEIDGFELTRRIKADPDLGQIPVVVLTAHGNEEAERRAEAVGCDGFLHKPADIRQIRGVLRQFLGAPVG
jgi:two-component system, cell cycle response regulator DivK